MKTRLLLAVAPILLTAACSVTPNYDSHFGEAVVLARAQQTIDPMASRNTNPVRGIDGKSAAAAIVLYDKSFTAPPPTQNIFNISFGGGK